jgi:integrase
MTASSALADKTFDRKGDAVRWEMEQKRLLQSGEFVSPTAGRITVRELAEEYRDSRQGQVSVRAWESDESALRVHIVPAFGKLPISSVSSVQIERFLTDLAVSRSVRTAARVRTTLRGLFRYAVRTRRLPRSPAEEVPLPRPDSRPGKVVEVHPFPLELLLGVVETQRGIGGRYADITLVLALSGLRFGELRGLRVRDLVDVPYPGLVVKRSIPQSGRTGAVIERATTKSGRSRLVPLSDRVRPVVESWAEGREPDDLLFPAPEGGYLHAQNWRAGRPLDDHRAGSASTRPAATAASLWIAAGVDIKTVPAWLGHSTAKLTLDTYGHLMGTDADRAALDRVNRVLGSFTGPAEAPGPVAGEWQERPNGG